MTTTTAVTSAAKTSRIAEREPVELRKRIGSTTYIIRMYDNPNATETLEDIITRLIESEVCANA